MSLHSEVNGLKNREDPPGRSLHAGWSPHAGPKRDSGSSRDARANSWGGPSLFDRWLPWTLALVLFLLALPGLDDYGLTWDEPTYFRFARLQSEWLGEIVGVTEGGHYSQGELFSRERISEVWLQHPGQNGHPPLNETWMGVAGSFVRAFTDHDLIAFRAVTALLFAFAAAAFYFLLRTSVSPFAAVFGVLTLAGVPAVWGHAHLGATEAMQLFFWCMCPLVLLRTLRARRWTWLVFWFAVCSAAFAGKFTNLLAILWALGTAGILGGWRMPRFWISCVIGVVAAPLSLVLFDPFFWPWQGGWGRFVDYLGQVGSRGDWIPIAVYYMGENWGFRPPWHYRLVETAAALPTTTLVSFVPGVGFGLAAFFRSLRQQALQHWVPALGITGLGITLVTGWLPSTPNHDITRQFVFVFVSVGLLAATFAQWVFERWGGRATATLLLPLASFFIAFQSEPWGLGYRAEWMGGTSGAWNKGFEVSYWGEAITPEMLRAVDDLRESEDIPPLIYSVPKLNYFTEAEDLWQGLVPELASRTGGVAADAVPAFYAPGITAEIKQTVGPWLRLTFLRPPDGILFFYRRGTIAAQFADVLDRLVEAGDLEIVHETRIDGVAVATLYRPLRWSEGALRGDLADRTWYQPHSLAFAGRGGLEIPAPDSTGASSK